MLKTIYLFELKKLFLTKVNLIALIVSVVMLVLLAISSISEDYPTFRETAKELDGRTIDEKLFEEIDVSGKSAFKTDMARIYVTKEKE